MTSQCYAAKARRPVDEAELLPHDGRDTTQSDDRWTRNWLSVKVSKQHAKVLIDPFEGCVKCIGPGVRGTSGTKVQVVPSHAASQATPFNQRLKLDTRQLY